ncbi:MAG: hypothetical protein KBT88_15680, partial [Gammaproteobacteria bacterium]|nr:hypothetical protein [Gammaproteobacteria bacterium]MBQ0841222.1 hypothetical protein [Gammaproteobacteria bacterium]
VFVSSIVAATSGQNVLEGVVLDVMPKNRYVKETSLTVNARSPDLIQKGQFVSTYYKEKIGYSKWVEKLDYFIVVISAYSTQDILTMELSSLKINLEDGTSVSPSEWSSAKVMPTQTPAKKAYLIDKKRVRCRIIKSHSLMEDIANQVIKVVPEEPKCFALKYPIPPVYPESKFSFSMEKVFVNGRDVSPLKFNFETISFKQTHGYRI